MGMIAVLNQRAGDRDARGAQQLFKLAELPGRRL
jgi:hypothetical protein